MDVERHGIFPARCGPRFLEVPLSALLPASSFARRAVRRRSRARRAAASAVLLLGCFLPPWRVPWFSWFLGPAFSQGGECEKHPCLFACCTCSTMRLACPARVCIYLHAGTFNFALPASAIKDTREGDCPAHCPKYARFPRLRPSFFSALLPRLFSLSLHGSAIQPACLSSP